MIDKKNMLTKDVSAGTALSSCPYCDSYQVWRIQRSEIEKIVCYLSNGGYMVKKYLCQSCQRATLLQGDGIRLSNAYVLEEDRIEGLIACAHCGLKKLQVAAVSVSEENTYRLDTGKTPFRKLTCLHCSNKTIISTEDFDAFNKQEF
jgi:DNA-directed RNA polymerase subunit RPC12/RpoP